MFLSTGDTDLLQEAREYRKNKRPFHHSSTDHLRVRKEPASCHHAQIMPLSALTIQAFACARTTCAATQGIRSTGILALPFGSLPLEWGEGFDGVSQRRWLGRSARYGNV